MGFQIDDILRAIYLTHELHAAYFDQVFHLPEVHMNFYPVNGLLIVLL